MLIIKKNGIFKKFFDSAEKHFHVQRELALKQFSDVTQQVHATFLLGKSFYQAKVCAVEVGNENTVVKFSKMVDNNLGSPAFINMKESNFGISEYP